MGLAVWSNAPDVPGAVCLDARLGGKAGGPAYPRGDTRGQGGWDVGIQYTNLHDLATKLFHSPVAPAGRSRPIQRGEVTRLAINAHGIGGQVFVNGKGEKPLTADNIGVYYQDLNDIGLATAEAGSVILFMGCLAGMGREGTRLLLELTKVWPGRKVVAFLTIGYAAGGAMKRRGETCSEPGMRETKEIAAGRTPEQLAASYGGLWNDLEAFPWASEGARGAKVALDGKVLKNENF